MKKVRSKEETERLKQALKYMTMADVLLRKGTNILSEFKMDVPSLNVGVIKIMADTVNSLDASTAFVKSFVRLSVLQQIVPKR